MQTLSHGGREQRDVAETVRRRGQAVACQIERISGNGRPVIINGVASLSPVQASSRSRLRTITLIPSHLKHLHPRWQHVQRRPAESVRRNSR